MRATFRPLRMETWDGEPTPDWERRSRNTFSASWLDTLDLLGRELEHLGAERFVIEADFAESDIRLDGMPRSGAKAPKFPGIRVAFDSKHGPLVYQADNCLYWQHNVRSIALGLQALRAVDRYGITHRAEQYTGFKALPSGGSNGGITAEEAKALLVNRSGMREWPTNPDAVRKLVRLARARAHPDVFDGDHAPWNEVEGAITHLRKERVIA